MRERKNSIIGGNATMDAKSLPAVAMPNRNGFFIRPTPKTANEAVIEMLSFGVQERR